MTIAVDLGRKATKQTKQNKFLMSQISLLSLFAKIKFSKKKLNLQHCLDYSFKADKYMMTFED